MTFTARLATLLLPLILTTIATADEAPKLRKINYDAFPRIRQATLKLNKLSKEFAEEEGKDSEETPESDSSTTLQSEAGGPPESSDDSGAPEN